MSCQKVEAVKAQVDRVKARADRPVLRPAIQVQVETGQAQLAMFQATAEGMHNPEKNPELSSRCGVVENIHLSRTIQPGGFEP